MNGAEKLCKQCKGLGFLRIAEPVAGAGFAIGMQQCYLCDDVEKWKYTLAFYEKWGDTPPETELLALGEEPGKLLQLPVKRRWFIFPAGPGAG